ncbi:MAG: HAD family hydrolase [Candidatus Lokiarchaeota archaeon]|nr:HAD family hydrolase [Candidatus Lokiarchaeota archaeon]
MEKNIIKAVAWDLDGTIIHFKIDFIKARQKAFEILEQNGIAKKLLSLDNNIIDTVKSARKIFKSNGFKKSKIEEIVAEIEDIVVSIEREAALNASAINGIQEVLEFNKKKGLKQAIYTYNHSINAQLSLEKVNLLQYFDLIAGRDTIKNPKPHPDHLTFICENLKVLPNQVVVIGDHRRDIEGALNIGAHSIGINSRLASRVTLEIAEIVIDEDEIPNELIKTIENLLWY